MNKDTVAIIFNGGSYGTYLEWCLTSLVNNNEIRSPFTRLGTSHIFKGNHLSDIDGWRLYVASESCHQFVRLHPKNKQSHSISANLNEIADHARHIVYLYPDQNRILLGVNNFFYKVWKDWVSHSFKTEIDPDKIYKNWPVDPGTPIEEVPNWIIREFLSFYLMPAWLDQIEWNHLSTWTHPKSINITVSEFLFDFENTLSRIEKFCNLEFKHSIHSLLPFHKKNLELQKYIDQDQICHQVIDSIEAGTYLEWEQLTMPSEAWIQWELRNQGFEIRCDGLDIFPTNSLHLKELLYPV